MMVQVRTSCALLLSCLWIVAGELRGEEPRRRALLVGCTRYDKLPKHLQLEGPANDVQLFKRLLAERLGFDRPGDEILVLAEGDDPQSLPTKANIQREFERLASSIKPGEFVFILMAGHGSQQPVSPNRAASSNEDDGLDEIFLPRDIDRWDGALGSVKNAITDNQINAWLTRMTDAGAHVWLIADHCHSGSVTRGATDEVSRAVPPVEIIPQAVLDAVAKNIADKYSTGKAAVNQDTVSQLVPKAESGAADNSKVGPSPSTAEVIGGFAAIYASEANDVTPELPLPANVPKENRRKFGLLSYTICEILTQSKQPLSYRELAQAVQNRYRLEFRRSPTPYAEGTFREHKILGREHIPPVSKFTLALNSDKKWVIDGGQLNGLSAKAVLEVRRAPGDSAADNSIVGYVSVVDVQLHQSEVEPCAYKHAPLVKELPKLAQCELVYQEIQPAVLLGVASKDLQGKDLPGWLVEKLYAELSQVRSHLVAITDDEDSAGWELVLNDQRLTCLPKVGLNKAGLNAHLNKFTVQGSDAEAARKVVGNLERIVKARNLIQVSQEMGEPGQLKRLDLEMKMSRVGHGELVPEAGVLCLADSDEIEVKLKNLGKRPLDVTLLYVDADSGIKCLFPDPLHGEINRLYGQGVAGNASETTFKIIVSAKEEISEHLICIAMRGGETISNFAGLEQSSLVRKSGADRFESPFGQLLKVNAFGVGTRGSSLREFGEFAIEAQCIQIRP